MMNHLQNNKACTKADRHFPKSASGRHALLSKAVAGILILLLLVMLPGRLRAFAESANIYDYAGLIEEEDETALEDTFAGLSESGGIDIKFLTVDGTDGKTQKKYLEDFVDEHCDNGDFSEDLAIMMIDMGERQITVQGYGKCEFYLNNDRIEYILDDVYSYVKAGDYSGAAELFATEAEYYMHEDKGVADGYEPGQDYGESYAGPSNYYGQDSSDTKVHLILLAVSFVIALITVMVLAGSAGGKITTTPATYLDPKSRGVTGSRDTYIRTTTTRTKRASDNNGGSHGGRSSGGGGVSSGGRSHSGGSRGF